MKKIIVVVGFSTYLLLASCSNEDGRCGRLGCLPDPVVSKAVQNTGASVITTSGGISGIVVYQAGTTFRAYDMQDPDKCTTEINARLTLSNDKLCLVSDSGEEFFLSGGYPTKGISCRGLIQYNITSQGQFFEVSN
ncbi:MAG: hypothetical protein ACK5MD_05420 [Flavobacteriales bacterium]